MGILKHHDENWDVTDKIQVEAYQVGSNRKKPKWYENYMRSRIIKPIEGGTYIKTFSGNIEFVPEGDYIINDKHNGVYSCNVTQFNDVFEEIE